VSARSTGAALLLCLGLALGLGACSSCPPDWAEQVPEKAGWIYAAGTCGEVFVDGDAQHLALARAARRLADALGLDFEHRLSVRHIDGHLFVEAIGPAGPSDALEQLELVELVSCGRRVHALLRLPRS
jgi:hypothetical protein